MPGLACVFVTLAWGLNLPSNMRSEDSSLLQSQDAAKTRSAAEDALIKAMDESHADAMAQMPAMKKHRENEKKMNKIFAMFKEEDKAIEANQRKREQETDDFMMKNAILPSEASSFIQVDENAGVNVGAMAASEQTSMRALGLEAVKDHSKYGGYQESESDSDLNDIHQRESPEHGQADSRLLQQQMQEVHQHMGFWNQQAKVMNREMNSLNQAIDGEEGDLRNEDNQEIDDARIAKEKAWKAEYDPAMKARFKNVTGAETDKIEKDEEAEVQKGYDKEDKMYDEGGDPVLLRMQELTVRGEVDAEELAGETPSKEQLEVAGLLGDIYNGRVKNPGLGATNANNDDMPKPMSTLEIQKIRDVASAQDRLHLNGMDINATDMESRSHAEAKLFEKKEDVQDNKWKTMQRKGEESDDKKIAASVEAVGSKYIEDKKRAAAQKKLKAVEDKQAEQMDNEVASLEVDDLGNLRKLVTPPN